MKRIKYCFRHAFSFIKFIGKIITDKPQIINNRFFNGSFMFVSLVGKFKPTDYEYKYQQKISSINLKILIVISIIIFLLSLCWTQTTCQRSFQVNGAPSPRYKFKCNLRASQQRKIPYHQYCCLVVLINKSKQGHPNKLLNKSRSTVTQTCTCSYFKLLLHNHKSL